MQTTDFMNILNELGAGFFTGVPDSLLSAFTDEIVSKYGIGEKHVVAANEGAAVGLAAGHYLATGNPAVVYMQNSGIGNAINPICSLLHEKVYAIPVIFVIGWRGEPGTKDEPQHIFQGLTTLEMLELVEIPYIVISNDYKKSAEIEGFKQHIQNGRSVAFVIKKDALVNENKKKYENNLPLSREESLKIILNTSTTDDVFVCTTGKLSREVYELRQNSGIAGRDFLTVGSMGHSLMIAFGIALAKNTHRVFCLDGDGAMLMHMGSVAVVGVHSPKNLVHVVINNGAHETVGGLTTVSKHIKLMDIAKAVGYKNCFFVKTEDELSKILNEYKTDKFIDGPIFIEIACNLFSRKDLGRPISSPIENKKTFMKGFLCH